MRTRALRPARGWIRASAHLNRLRAEDAKVLDAYWAHRGVVDEGVRKQLVAIADEPEIPLAAEVDWINALPGRALPGRPCTSSPHMPRPKVDPLA